MKRSGRCWCSTTAGFNCQLFEELVMLEDDTLASSDEDIKLQPWLRSAENLHLFWRRPHFKDWALTLFKIDLPGGELTIPGEEHLLGACSFWIAKALSNLRAACEEFSLELCQLLSVLKDEVRLSGTACGYTSGVPRPQKLRSSFLTRRLR